MTDRKTNEEIIELTEVVEEGSPLATKRKEEAPPEPPRGASAGNLTGSEKKDSAGSHSEKKATATGPRFPSLGHETEILALQERWNARIEAWLAKEGVQTLEQVAREMFPRIAEKVLRTEIEKLKKEAEESE